MSLRRADRRLEPSAPAAPRSRFDAVLRARDAPTGCGFSMALGTATPCGIVLVYCDDAGSFDRIAVLTSKTQEALNLEDHLAVLPKDFDAMELAMLQAMRGALPGPFYHNVFIAPGPVLSTPPTQTGAWRSAPLSGRSSSWTPRLWWMGCWTTSSRGPLRP